MKRTMVFTALFTLFCASPYAADASLPQPTTPAAATTPATPVAAAPAMPATPAATTPTSATTTTTTSSTPAGTVTTQSTTVQPAAPVINCEYRIPADTKQIDQTLITTWSEKATVQSFDFTPAAIDDQLNLLKTCFTDQGWQGFNDALQKSGNVNSIKTQNLTVSSQIDGTSQVSMVKNNQWKVTVPVQVVYQNDKEKLTQLLTVDLLVGRKVSGDLGIMQMIATPRTPAPATAATPTTPATPVTAPTASTPVITPTTATATTTTSTTETH